MPAISPVTVAVPGASRNASVTRFVLTLALLLRLGAIVSAADAPAATNSDATTVIIVVGAAGEEEFGKDFLQASDLWETACKNAGAKYFVVGKDSETEPTDQQRLKTILENEPKESANELWIVLLGHGTFDNREAKFNLRGPDLAADDFAKLLLPFSRPVAFLDCSASSSPFINKISKPGRVVLSATRSGAEINYARFGQYLSQGIASPDADLDRDGQTSLLEGFLFASQRVTEFYQGQERLVTEHPLMDDNGDATGTPPDWFRGVRAVKKSTTGAAADGPRAHQFHLVRSEKERKLSPETRRERDQLELSVVQLRDAKETMEEEAYYASLEALLLDLAHFYQRNEPK